MADERNARARQARAASLRIGFSAHGPPGTPARALELRAILASRAALYALTAADVNRQEAEYLAISLRARGRYSDAKRMRALHDEVTP